VLQDGRGPESRSHKTALKAGLPDTIAAFTVNKWSAAPGLKAVMLAAQAIRAGDRPSCWSPAHGKHEPRAVFAVRAPARGWKYGDQNVVDAMIHDGPLGRPSRNWHHGRGPPTTRPSSCAVTREDQDRFALRQPATGPPRPGNAAAFTAEVVPVTVGSGPKAKTVRPRRRAPRPDASLEGLREVETGFLR